MVRYTLKLLQHFLQDFQSMSDHDQFGGLSIKGLYALAVCSSPKNVRTQGWNDFENCN